MTQSSDSTPFDLVVRGATIVDGSGAKPFIGDVGVREDKIAAIGVVASTGVQEIDGKGLVLSPGFVDPHTHYDAQLFWDPLATPSSLHGVTTVVSGNCGFTLAPLAAGDSEYTARMMANVEGMPLEALQQALPWDWQGFGDYLDRLDGKIAVNAGFLVGHCAIRRAVMGSDAIGKEATPSQIEAMTLMLGESLASGGLGFSTSRAFTHSDGAGDPVASRWASEEEVLALSSEVAEHEGTTLEFIFDGCLNGFKEAEIELAAAMSLAADRPANWNVLTVSASDEKNVRAQVAACEAAAAKGAKIVALTMPVIVDLCMSFKNHCALHKLPRWSEVLTGSVEEQIERLQDPAVREQMKSGAKSPEAGVLRGVAQWGSYKIGNGPNPDLADLRDRSIADIAAERDQDEFDTLVEIVIADSLATILWPISRADDDASWDLRLEVWDSPHVMLGGSDAGAHLDRMCGAPYPTLFLADVLRGRKLVSLERAIAMMTSEPADLFGLKGRGRIREGAQADLVLFDPETIGATGARAVEDLPDGSLRLVSDPFGIRKVIVNGQVTVDEGKGTGACAGTLLRSGRDTDTVRLSIR
jgi:N-acyl-D-aspartate/D-glutamate deacylase